MTEREALLLLMASGYSLAWRSTKVHKIADVLADLLNGSQSVSIEYDSRVIRIWDRSSDRIDSSPLWHISRQKAT